jgi:hypothetical protein
VARALVVVVVRMVVAVKGGVREAVVRRAARTSPRRQTSSGV